MSTQKTASPMVDKNGKPLKDGISAPDWFVRDGIDVIDPKEYAEAGVRAEKFAWGNVFSTPRIGNDVKFFVTGRDYFQDVAAAIQGAATSIFIIGWQVNFDVELVPGKTLLQYLHEVVRKPGGPCVYVMPWMSPGVVVNNNDFETMLAVFHLNWGLGKNKRAFAVPAMQQSDMGALSLMFSHHQKLVVIDNTTAYMGGMDLAYGRRDDGRYLLSADGRTGNELYNSCVPHVHAVTNTEMTAHYLTKWELVMGCSDSKTGKAGAFITSPSFKALSVVLDAKSTASDFVKDKTKAVSDWWRNVDLTPQFMKSLQDMAVDGAQESAKWGYGKLPEGQKKKIQGLADWGSGIAESKSAAMVGWLNGASLDSLPSQYIAPMSEMIQALNLEAMASLADAAANRQEPYENLLVKWKRMAPILGSTVDPDLQPRMPWHDVHCRIQGPSVYDLSMNFVKRWDGIACEYENARGRLRSRPLVQAALKASTKKDALGTAQSWLPKIKKEHKLEKPIASSADKCTIQVLRSAPLTLLKDECNAGKEKAPALKQNNCLKAMIRAIRNSKHFLYIEGQFFQSDFGAEGPNRGDKSGPLGALMDIKRSPGYRKFAKELQIEGAAPEEFLTRVRLAKVDDVMKDPDWPRFKKDLDDVLKNVAIIQGMDQFGKPQKHLENPLGQTLVCRFRKAILDDNLPYHVYMVLPVHPEGTLNTLNIMSQTHLTMHSLSLGDDSLINGIRRALMERRLFNARTPKPKGAAQVEQAQREIQAEVRKIDTETLAKRIGDEWREYLTLLNLRNWETIGGRPVTEMIYVHSKLLIADDQVAILGSANINDRSQLGERDSELAVIIHDSDQKSVALDGKKPSYVSACVHELRKSLWSKIFGLRDGAKRPASDLAGVLDKPMAPETWKKIQQVAIKNADAYEKAFLFTPRNRAPVAFQAPMEGEDKPPASIWPVWRYNQFEDHNAGGRMAYRMPFEYSFWRKPDVRSDSNTWEAKTYATEQAPDGVQGFIVDLPVNWTMYENNNTGFNLAMIAMNDPLNLPGFSNQEPKTQMAAIEPTQPSETIS